MQKYLKLVSQLVNNFLYAEFVQIPQDQNTDADEVARSALADNQDKMNDWKLEEQNSPSSKKLQTFPIHNSSGWTNPILSLLQMDDYHQTSKKPGRFRSALPGLQY